MYTSAFLIFSDGIEHRVEGKWNIGLKWVNGINVINGNLNEGLYSKHIFKK